MEKIELSKIEKKLVSMNALDTVLSYVVGWIDHLNSNLEKVEEGSSCYFEYWARKLAYIEIQEVLENLI